jgi:hypothetical protein
MSRIRRRACRETLEKKDAQAIATPVLGKKLLMAKRIVLGIAVAAIAAVALVFAFKF